MGRQEFIGAAAGIRLLDASPTAPTLLSTSNPISVAESSACLMKPMSLGLSTYSLSLDDFIGKFTKCLAHKRGSLLSEYGIVAEAHAMVGPTHHWPLC
jgi:hypothetical protein